MTRNAESVLRALPWGVVTTSPDGRVTAVNPCAAAILGAPADDLEGRLLAELIPGAVEAIEGGAAASDGGAVDGPETRTVLPRTRVVPRDGSEIAVDLVLDGSDAHARVLFLLPPGQAELIEWRSDWGAGGGARWDAVGAESHRRQRLENVGALVAGVAHELNNLLVPVLTWAEALERHVDEDGLDPLQRLRESVEHGRDLCSQILAMSRRAPGSPVPFSPAEAVTRALEFIERTTSARVSVRAHLGAPDARLFGDPRRIEQVVMNLCTNAAQAVGERGGRITVALGRAETVSPRGKAQIVLAVEDDGPGLTAEEARRVFEPFYSTRTAAGGTGLGLAVVDGIVRLHGGSIELVDSRATGARFELVFPEHLGSDAGAPSTGE